MMITQILLVLHIISGVTSLSTGSINLIMKKGCLIHRRVGRIFHVAMIFTAISAICLAIIHPNGFLLCTAFFSLYLVESGRRMVNADKYKGTLSQNILYSISILAAIGFILYGLLLFWQSKNFGVVPMTFGIISILLVRQELLITNYKFNTRIRLHIGRITGAYIASATAFLVVNNTLLPGWIAWLLPTAILVPLIIKWSRIYTA